jgi:hypothetical protein
MEDETILVVEWERVPMETNIEKWIEYEYMFAFLNCWIFVLLYLLWYSCFNNMHFVSGPSHTWQE